MPLTRLAVFIYYEYVSLLDDSSTRERQIRDGRFPSLRRLQMPTGYYVDLHGRIHRAVCKLERTMKSQAAVPHDLKQQREEKCIK